VVDRVLQVGAATPAAYWRDLFDAEKPCALVLWSDASAISGLAELSGEPPLPPIYLGDDPYSGLPPAFDPRLAGRLRFISMINPAAPAPQWADWTAWMSRHHLPVTEPLLQANAYFVMSLMDEAVRANGGDFTPEHLIERIEYSAGSVVQHPMLASLSLGMGQRFAAKGGYIISPAVDGAARPAALGGLIVP